MGDGLWRASISGVGSPAAEAGRYERLHVACRWNGCLSRSGRRFEFPRRRGGYISLAVCGGVLCPMSLMQEVFTEWAGLES